MRYNKWRKAASKLSNPYEISMTFPRQRPAQRKAYPPQRRKIPPLCKKSRLPAKLCPLWRNNCKPWSANFKSRLFKPPALLDRSNPLCITKQATFAAAKIRLFCISITFQLRGESGALCNNMLYNVFVSTIASNLRQGGRYVWTIPLLRRRRCENCCEP